MIDTLELTSFKRFPAASFQLGTLTVLSGLNGTGKTTLVQSILLARAASVGDGASVPLNGPFGIELGAVADVRNWRSEDEPRIVMVDREGATHTWQFRASQEHALHLDVEARPDPRPAGFGSAPRAFTYLCAERLGPRAVLGSTAVPPGRLEVGVQGEFVAQVLDVLGNTPVEQILDPQTRDPSVARPRVHPATSPDEPTLLKYVAERWLADIVRPLEIDGKAFEGSRMTRLRFRVPGGEWVHSTNMGFGATYALPVVLGGLIAARGGLFVVENPEAHLHPRGQSWMGSFLAQLAAAGVQVIVETHSDHVLHGVRRAIGEHQTPRAGEAVVLFFGADDDAPGARTLRFTDVGGIEAWPPGFFDQYQIDVTALTRVRRPR